MGKKSKRSYNPSYMVCYECATEHRLNSWGQTGLCSLTDDDSTGKIEIAGCMLCGEKRSLCETFISLKTIQEIRKKSHD